MAKAKPATSSAPTSTPATMPVMNVRLRPARHRLLHEAVDTGPSPWYSTALSHMIHGATPPQWLCRHDVCLACVTQDAGTLALVLPQAVQSLQVATQ